MKVFLWIFMPIVPFMPDLGVLILPILITILKHGKRGLAHKSHMQTFFVIQDTLSTCEIWMFDTGKFKFPFGPMTSWLMLLCNTNSAVQPYSGLSLKPYRKYIIFWRLEYSFDCTQAFESGTWSCRLQNNTLTFTSYNLL